MTDVVTEWKGQYTWGFCRGDDGRRYYISRHEVRGRAPRLGERYEFDVVETPAGPAAVGARRLEPATASAEGR